MTDWVGGLPPAAHDRVQRQRRSGTASSLFSAPAAAAAGSAGLAPVGEVFGCLVMHLGWANNGCGWYGQMGGWGAQGMFGGVSPVHSTARRGSSAGLRPYVQAFDAGWHGARDRMLAEAQALGADGVVDVHVTRSHLGSGAWEFAALGTAVRAVDPALAPARDASGAVWSAGLSAEDCAAAILSGRVPARMVFGMAVATKHEDYQMKQQRMSWSNQEVDGLTALLQTARHDARVVISARAARSGGDLVIKGMHVHEFETPCGQNESDVHVEAAIEGTVLVPGPTKPFRRGDLASTSRVVPVMSLSDLPRL